MYITEKSLFASFPTPFRAFGKRSSPTSFDLVARSFDDSVLRGLKALNPPASNTPLIGLSWLSSAVDFLASVHVEARDVLANLSSSDDTIKLYLDGSVKVLDLCNFVSAEIERLRQRRLLINFALLLLDDEKRSPEKLRRAVNSLSDEPKTGTRQKNVDPNGLVRDLADRFLSPLPSGRISNAEELARRTLYAVGVVTVFVFGAVVSALSGGGSAKIDVSATGFPWADSLSQLRSAILNRRVLEEIGDVETRAGRARDTVNDVGQGNEASHAKLGNAVKELRAASERLTEGLDRLANGVNGVFRLVLGTRDGILDAHRKRHEGDYEKKQKK
ncbi:protein BPS1, chloroplastic-like [Diospyros lotus]|uniref:protein BPS1, chloroplastic-like n=1 Tax=Diospyros lotus TaxID=55363 RepID=UPI00225B26C2|nr:protein BPS1, chloroplastic-like [Diospyros lotus]